MREQADRVDRVVARIARGEPVAWEREVADSPSVREAEVLRCLRVLDRMRGFGETLESTGDPEAALASVRETEDRAGTTERVRRSPRQLPDTWGSLRVEGELGRGSYGTVLLCTDPRLQRQVALKLYEPCDEDDVPATLLHEGQLMARVQHPNLVGVYGAAMHGSRPGLWMELVNGRTLEELVGLQGTLDAREAAKIGIDVCRALGALHAAEILHRDVKTQNVMRQEGGRIVLMDLGAAQGELRAPAWRTDGAVGTPLYMAPELLLDGAPASVRSDIYAVGVLLYRLVTHDYPVPATSLEELLRAHESGPRRLTEKRPDVDRRFAAAIMRALSPEPEERHASAADLEQELENAFPVSPAGKIQDGKGRDQGRDVRRAPVMTPVRAILAGAAVIAIALLSWSWLGLGRGDLGVEARLLRSRGGTVAALAVSGADVRPGDRLELQLRADQPAHVYVIGADDRGAVYVLHPHSGRGPPNPLAADALHSLPPDAGGTRAYWELDGKAGREYMLLIVARTPLEEIEAVLQELPPPASAGLSKRPLGVDLPAVKRLRETVGASAVDEAPRLLRALERVARVRGSDDVFVQRFTLTGPVR